MAASKMYEVVEVGEEKLVGEMIKLSSDVAFCLVHESTTRLLQLLLRSMKTAAPIAKRTRATTTPKDVVPNKTDAEVTACFDASPLTCTLEASPETLAVNVPRGIWGAE